MVAIIEVIPKEQVKKEKQQNYRLYKTYGITLMEWKIKLEETSNTCSLCGNYGKLNVDHRHIKDFKTLSPEEKRKEVRGPLCYRCNKWTLGGLEIHKDARKVLNNLNKYAAKYKLKGDE